MSLARALRRASTLARRARTFHPRALPTIDDDARALFDDVDALASFRADADGAVARAQLGHACAQAVGAGSRCAHGYARAYLYAPLSVGDGEGGEEGALRAEHATCWLACPALVEATNALERENGIHDVARAVEASEERKESLSRAHEDAPRVRRWLMGEEMVRRVRDEATTAKGEKARFIVDGTGLIGVNLSDLSTTKTWKKVKCLHAQIADALVRGRGKNAVGALALDALVERGVAVDGTETCWRRCAPKKGGRGDVEE